MLYDFCETHNVGIKRVGKLLVVRPSREATHVSCVETRSRTCATHAFACLARLSAAPIAVRDVYALCGVAQASREEELPTLSDIAAKARANGLESEDEALQQLTSEEAAQIEPAVRCVGALFSPSTGIVNSHELTIALQGSAEAHGAQLVLGTRVLGGRVLGGSGRLRLTTPDAELECDEVVNAAGHGAIPLARAFEGFPSEHVPPQHWAKGSYFGLVGRSPFRGLVYPVPSQAGLGVHATVDLAGRCRFGPDVQWTDRDDDFDVDPRRSESFYAAVREYWPELPDGALVPDYAGIRPKIQGPGEPAKDFQLLTPAQHGVPRLLHLFGIESPGLTASLALGQYCVDALGPPA